jgi:hypothetical protein
MRIKLELSDKFVDEAAAIDCLTAAFSSAGVITPNVATLQIGLQRFKFLFAKEITVYVHHHHRTATIELISYTPATEGQT